MATADTAGTRYRPCPQGSGGRLEQGAAALDVRRRPLLLEVRERDVEAGRVATLGGEQRRPGLGEAGTNAAVDLGGACELAGGGSPAGLEPQVADDALRRAEILVHAAELEHLEREVPGLVRCKRVELRERLAQQRLGLLDPPCRTERA